MSKAEILAELANLTAEDREEILDRLWRLEEEEVIRPGPTILEKAILDRELGEYQAKPDPGTPWSEMETRLRRCCARSKHVSRRRVEDQSDERTQ